MAPLPFCWKAPSAGCGGAERRASRATLEISGQRAGQVVLDAAPDSTNAFLGLNLNSSP